MSNKPRTLQQPDGNPARGNAGFTLAETLIAITILTFGLLAAGQLIFLSLSSTTLARSKGSAAIAAQNQLEFLADLYRQNPADTNLTDGAHGPRVVQVTNSATGAALNRYNVAWNVSTVSDPRVGRVLNAKQVRVTVTPIDAGSNTNNRATLNKVVNVTSIISMRAR